LDRNSPILSGCAFVVSLHLEQYAYAEALDILRRIDQLVVNPAHEDQIVETMSLFIGLTPIKARTTSAACADMANLCKYRVRRVIDDRY
jgi:hypothetical protein